MSGIVIQGMGAVSPAGWALPSLMRVLENPEFLPTQTLSTPGGVQTFQVRTVPSPTVQPSWVAHPRLRRSSAISQFALGASLEALQMCARVKSEPARFGIVTGSHAACLRYAGRFYGEVLNDPRTASPMVFPETVINAPASHLATYLGGAKLTYSLTGDQTVFIQAMLIGAKWLAEHRVDMCLVVGAEEVAWPVADAIRHFSRTLICAEGAGALVLTRPDSAGCETTLERITDAHLYAGEVARDRAVRAMRNQIPPESEGELLVDSRCGVPHLDQAETFAWQDWQGPRISPRALLGEALSAATAWQCVAACASLQQGRAQSANVSAIGGNQQAIGVRFKRGN